ncbi:2-dehydropantoate 2-reductase [Salinarimonas sp.]|uniref:ketopantoate reductase family protein n=1 Tax=Salinarimonas sp. TaxID=2766526 RepID=UPI0032D8B644
MRIAIVGAGGVGAAYGALLAEAGHDVRLLARGAHLAAMRERGLTVVRDGVARTPTLTASDVAADLGVADVAILAVKLWGTEEAGEAARELVGPDTLVITLQNGVDSRDRLAPILGADRVVAGIAQISAVIDEPGVVVHRSPFARIIVGEPDGRPSARLDRFVAACIDAGIEARQTPEIDVELWAKFVFIASLSSACGVFRAGVGPILADAETRAFLIRLFEEAVAVGRAEGVALPDDQVARTLAFTEALPPTMRASMLDDLERGARLELPWLGGRVVAGGRRAGVPTPAHETAALALKLHAEGR